MAKDKNGVGRRGFLKGATFAGAASFAAPLDALAQDKAPAAPSTKMPQGISAAQAAAENQPPSPEIAKYIESNSGSDFMVDALKSVGFEYISALPGSSFRGLQESFVNYGKNSKPEWLTVTHEENSVAMSQGYAKVEGKPILNLVHATVGLQHASMALYNAYADRVPIFVITANIANAPLRRPGIETFHTVQDGAVITRDFTKWDDSPGGLQHFAESTVRAYQIAMTPPMGPVVLVADSALQEEPLVDRSRLTIPRFPQFSPAQGDSGAVAELARQLVNAESPVILADRGVPGPNGMFSHLVELAELLQCPVVDMGGRLNFPNRHPLNMSLARAGVISQADLILGLEMTDFWGALHSYRDQLHRTSRSIIRPDAKTASITSADQFIKANYQSFQRYPGVDIEISGDGAATLPLLIEAVKQNLDAGKKSTFDGRGKKFADAHQAAVRRVKSAAAAGWDLAPISTARMCMEIWNQIKGEDYSFLSGNGFPGIWPLALWNMDKPYRFLGDSGAGGVGYITPGAVGAALANRKYGRFSVAITGDGDLMIAPGSLWTAAKHKIPLLLVVHNNRAYFQEMMHVQTMANRHVRDIHTARIGTEIADPNIDFATLARSMGVYGEGPITDPADLGPALQRAVAVVKKGEPALVDVVSQGR
jgi:acetolactate synthase I/II/III large subunit